MNKFLKGFIDIVFAFASCSIIAAGFCC